MKTIYAIRRYAYSALTCGVLLMAAAPADTARATATPAQNTAEPAVQSEKSEGAAQSVIDSATESTLESTAGGGGVTAPQSTTTTSAATTNTTTANSDAPLEIMAQETLEWHRQSLKYIARGQASAKQGNVTIYADTLTADYRETAASDMDIYRLTAENNVRIVSDGNEVVGDHAIYTIDDGRAIMTGKALTMTSPDQVITARDSFEYFVPQGEVRASGAVKVRRPEDTLEADRMSAFFVKDANGENKLERMTADNNVVITTPEEVLRGRRGVYQAGADTAELIGAVRIERGPNVLQGDRAEVNLTTNVSKIHGGETSQAAGGRVRAVFYPNADKKDAGSPRGTAPGADGALLAPALPSVPATAQDPAPARTFDTPQATPKVPPSSAITDTPLPADDRQKPAQNRTIISSPVEENVDWGVRTTATAPSATTTPLPHTGPEAVPGTTSQTTTVPAPEDVTNPAE